MRCRELQHIWLLTTLEWRTDARWCCGLQQRDSEYWRFSPAIPSSECIAGVAFNAAGTAVLASYHGERLPTSSLS
jgi:hypothetical protein